MKRKGIILGLGCFLVLCFTFTAYGQNKTVSGKVTDAQTGKSLSGVNILVKGTTTGAFTDENGHYKLEVSSLQDTLRFSFIGYETKNVSIGGRTTVNITLQPTVFSGQQLVVIAFGEKKQKNLVSSVSSIKSDRLQSKPITSFSQALNGTTTGLHVATTSGTPGDLPTITIRGKGSITAGTNPLFVVDGFPTDQRYAESINPNEIESVSVLKDAAATALYGSRGANGVILITTKQGKKGESHITVNASGGITYVPPNAREKLLNAKQYVQYYTEFYSNKGMSVPDAIKNWDGKTNTNWQDVIYRKAPFQKYNLTASGGSSKVNYFLSAGYTDSKGAVIATGQHKYTARLKIDYHPSEHVDIGLNIAPDFNTFKHSSDIGADFASAVSLANMLPPILPVKNPDGTYATQSQLGYGLNLANPVALSKNYLAKSDLFRSIGQMHISVNLLNSLTIESRFGVNYGTNRDETSYNPQAPRNQLPPVSTLSITQLQDVGWLNQNTIKFKQEVAENNTLGILAGFTIQSDKVKTLNASANDFGSIGPKALAFGSTSSLTANNTFAGNTLISYLGRLNYAFKNKYLLTASIRRDGSSRFGINKRFSTFGSIAGGWVISDEPFMQNLEAVSNAKIRASYGYTGSDQIGNFAARSLLITENVAMGNEQLKGVHNGAPGNPNLTWEKSKQFDVGLNLGFLNNRITAQIDYYRNITSSLLLNRNLPLSSGFEGYLTNIGSMKNAGIEISANAVLIRNKNFEWSVGGNLTHDREKVLNLGGADNVDNFFGVITDVVGKSLNQITSVKAIGIVQEGEHPAAQPNAKPGDVLYLDANNDGEISSFLGPDGIMFGSNHPDFVYGINTNVSYKNLNLSVNLQGQSGAITQDFYLIQIAVPFNQVNLSKKFWYDGRYISSRKPGNGRTPKAGSFQTSANGVGTVSSLGIQSTNYLRITNATLTYSLPRKIFNQSRIDQLQFYTSVENLYTFTKFIGPNNPQHTSYGVFSLTTRPTQALPRVWTFGIKVKF
jgi:TonB-linked SusC/RagA family outer membrane protein